MNYKICKQMDSADLMNYLFENKSDIIPSAIEQMYGNESAIGMRLEHNMEVAVLAFNEEEEEVQGVVSAISPNMDNNWTIVSFHVIEKARRQEIASNLLQTLKKALIEKKGAVKCAASIMNNNKKAGACFLVNGFDFEGKLAAVEKEKEIAIYGTVFTNEEEG